MRSDKKQAYGYDREDPTDSLHKAIRAHSNLCEYAPMLSILMLYLEWKSIEYLYWPFYQFMLVLLCLGSFSSRMLLTWDLCTTESLAKPTTWRFIGAWGNSSKLFCFSLKKRRMANALEETRSVVHEAVNVFNPSHDIESVQALNRTLQETQNARQQQQLYLKNLIRELANSKQQSEERIQKNETDDSHLQQIKKMDKEKSSISKVIMGTEADCEKLSAQTAQLDDEIKNVKSYHSSLDIDSGIEIHSTRILISLYSNLSNIRWDYDEPTLVKGYVSKGERNDVRPFQLDPSKSSDFFITNYLWELIEC